ncbi:MAG: hypothetical protein AAF213_02470 [Pseudomonadota bacterium]
MNTAPASHTQPKNSGSKPGPSLDAETLSDWLGLQPGQKTVATSINADTGVLQGLRMALKQKVDGRQIAVALDSYAVAPQTGAQTEPVLRLTFDKSRTGDALKLRQVSHRGQRLTLATGQMETLLEEVARISQSLRRQYLPAIASLDAMLSPSVAKKGV